MYNSRRREFINRYLLQTNGYAPIPAFQFMPPKAYKTCDSIQFSPEDMHHSKRRTEKESTSGRNEKKYLRKQGYPKKLIEDGIEKSKNLDRKQLINTPSPDVTTQEIIPFVTTYNPKNKNITPFVKHLNEVLKTNESVSKVLENFRVIESKRQPKNLKRILCKSNFRNNILHTVRTCPDQRCGTCPYLKEGIIFKIGDWEFKVNSSMTCRTKNLIYCIMCGGCGQYYIGETGTTLRTRIRVHKQQILHPEYRKIKGCKNLDICGKGHFTVIPLYNFYSDNVVERRETEKHFIQTLKPSLNSDLSKK